MAKQLTKTVAGSPHTRLLLSTPRLKRVLERTWGLWRGRRLDPLAYQRRMRKEYDTLRPRGS